MALAALIAAYHESGEPGHLRATLPLAGRTVIERQARLAAAAGCSPVIVLVERLPAALSAALNRLRREHVPIEIARSAEEAGELVDPYDRILLVGDGAVTPAAQHPRIAEGDDITVLTVPDGAYGEPYERIDAGARWGGLAAIDGAMLRETASMLRDWDLQSTLLRRALQAGARHVPAEGAVAILDSQADLGALERRIVEQADASHRCWSDWLLGPIERSFTQLFMGGGVSPAIIGLAGALVTGLGAVAFYVGWSWLGLSALVAATPFDGIAGRLARLRMQDSGRQSWWSYLLPLFSAAALVVLANRLAVTQGWGMVLVAVMTLAFLFALAVETEKGAPRGALLLAERKGMIWLMLPFAAAGLWAAGLATLFAYAAASFFWAQSEAHGRQD